MAEKLPGGHETILLVDDQETVWDFLIEALQNLGYSVILAENGLPTLRAIKLRGGSDAADAGIAFMDYAGDELEPNSSAPLTQENSVKIRKVVS